MNGNIIPDAARWTPKVTRREMELRYFFDAGDPWRGIKIGKSYGTLFHRAPGVLIPVKYDLSGQAMPLRRSA